MVLYSVILFCSWMSSTWAVKMSFPSDFKFGVASAAYQIEGAWNSSDKTESIWDVFTHEHPEAIADRSNGDVACDSYHLWKRDVEMAKEMNLHFYRFSISWPRLLPTGYDTHISEDGKNYYNNLIDELLKNDIEPIVTLYHWDLPQTLQDRGGWTNPLIEKWFAAYANVAFRLFGDRVKTWITINEPLMVCDLAYGTGSMAPGILEPICSPALCIRHLMLAHAAAYRLYHRHFSGKNGHSAGGQVSIANHLVYLFPQSEKDQNMTDLLMEYINGRYVHPIFSEEGGWPSAISKVIKESSEKQDLPCCRLPHFSKREKEFIKGTYDFFGLNYYISRVVQTPAADENTSFGHMVQIPELTADLLAPPNATVGYVKIQTIFPEGLRGILNWVTRNYGHMKIFITENGYSTTGSNLKDGGRIKYIEDHLKQVYLSINEDNVDVTGYAYWSLLDNFEWGEGYLARFGLYETNYTDMKRTPRNSASYYSNIIKDMAINT